MSECGQGHELVKDMWLKFPGLAAEAEILVKKRVTSLNKTSKKYNSVVKGLKYM